MIGLGDLQVTNDRIRQTGNAVDLSDGGFVGGVEGAHRIMVGSYFAPLREMSLTRE